MYTYTAKKCSCWYKYPNAMHKRSNGQWKCVDCYMQVKESNGITRKTKCVLIEDREESKHDKI